MTWNCSLKAFPHPPQVKGFSPETTQEEASIGSFDICGASLQGELYGGSVVDIIHKSSSTLAAHMWPIRGMNPLVCDEVGPVSLRPLQLFSSMHRVINNKKSSLLSKGLFALTNTHILLPIRKKRRKGLVVLEGSHTCYIYGGFLITKY